jgi:hypothetical protein
MALVELARFYNGLEANVARSRLESEGVESFLFDTEMNWGGLDGVVPVRLMVDEEDLGRVRRILNEVADRPRSA